uniref:DNA primase family protein n=1 Tax=Candidatus Magnetaquicoccus inordinatus TaxID=2496818 RepID=UPI001D0ED14F
WDAADAGAEGYTPEQCAKIFADPGNFEESNKTAIIEQSSMQVAALPPLAVDVHMTDLGNARLIVQEHGGNIRYVHQWGKWFVWKDTHWHSDDDGGVERLAKQTMMNLYYKALGAPDQTVRFKHAMKSQQRTAIRDAIALAQTEPGVALTSDRLDSNPWLLNVLNGTLDLRFGVLRSHDKHDLITRVIPVSFDPSAQCPTWDKFVARVTNGDGSLIRFLQKAMGYTLTGVTSEHCLFYIYGDGLNGKSTFLELQMELSSGYARRISSESLMVKAHGAGIPNDLAGLVAARYVAGSEVEEGSQLYEARLKEWTGGDTVTARFLHREFFEFRPQFKLWLAGNYKPIIKGTDKGIWRRFHLIPFTAVIRPDEIDKKLPSKLKAELSGILRWAVEGCLMWQSEGLLPPAAVQEATAEYRAESDLIGLFLEERTRPAPGAEFSTKAVYAAYKLWAESGGLRPISSMSFSRKLKDKGVLVPRASGSAVSKVHGLVLAA